MPCLLYVYFYSLCSLLPSTERIREKQLLYMNTKKTNLLWFQLAVFLMICLWFVFVFWILIQQIN